MKNMRILGICLCSLMLVISCSITAVAMDTEVQVSESIEVEIFDSLEEAIENAEIIAEKQVTLHSVSDSNQTRKVLTAVPVFYRTYTGSNLVNFYIHITAGDYNNALQYRNIEIFNSSLLFPDLLTTFSPNTTRTITYDAFKTGMVFLGNLQVPEEYDTLRVDWDFISIYVMNYGWTSPGTDPMGSIPIG